MALLTTLFIAVGLAMDAFAASVAGGFLYEGNRLRNAFRVSVFFGLFQAVMPVFGWLIAFRAHGFILWLDHWIAFVLLLVIGLRMIFESARKRDKGSVPTRLGTGILLALSIATSIDAFAVGITFALLDTNILVPVCIIGAVTFVLSLLGFLAAKKIGRVAGRYVGIIGGLILIGIGIKILVEHLRA